MLFHSRYLKLISGRRLVLYFEAGPLAMLKQATFCGRMEAELLKELALALYAQELLSFGKARELANLDYWQFSQLLGERRSPGTILKPNSQKIWTMPVVSNTSPLLNLATIDHLFLLPQQFGQILIPQAVFRELKVDQPLPGSSLLQEAMNEGWLVPQAVINTSLVTLLRRQLHQGEA